MTTSVSPADTKRNSLPRVLLFLAALWLLDGMLTFHNVWPTLLVRWSGELSVELAGVLVVLSVWQRLRGDISPALLRLCAMLFVAGAVSRYGAVTAQALYGREVNLYWDLPNLSSVTAMLSRVASWWILIAMIAGAMLLLAVLYQAAIWSLRRVACELHSPGLNGVVGIVAAAMLVWFTLQRLDDRLPRVPQFSIPITQTYLAQIHKVRSAIGDGASDLPASPVLASTLSLVGSSDLSVVFVESYGRVAYDRPEFFNELTAARQTLEKAVRDTGRDMVSGFVESPTFGGGSWLAHISFLTGIDVRDAGIGQRLMTQTRRTLGSELARHNYRRVALMPGLKNRWPEGAFYGFDRIYDDAGLEYAGPSFGWWRIPDQFTLAKFDTLESERQPRQPLFTFFPTVSTHTPFRPTPPYQPDWSRMLDQAPYAASALQHALLQSPEWNNMGSSYVGAVNYSLEVLAGYLRTHSDPNLILVILGDHQPPALVSGEGASWDVPVHVIANNQAVLMNLRQRGFVSGIVPSPATLEPMYRLAGTLLATFEEQPTQVMALPDPATGAR